MSRFEGLVDQERPLRILAGILAKGNIPHAFLFTGIDGIGKRTTAILFAMARNCQALQASAATDGEVNDTGAHGIITPCGRCNPCVKIMAGTHPDVIVVQPEGDVIKIAQVRELSQRLTFKPHEAKSRVVVISDAQAMNVEASNALLKALEEPPPQTYFILTAGQMADLLPTVVSRCQHIRFNPVAAEKIAHHLVHTRGLAPPEAGLAAVVSEGSMSKALELAERPALIEEISLRRKWLVTEMIELPSRSLPVILMFAEKLAADKKHVMSLLEMIKRFLRDAAVGRFCPEKIAGTDLREAVLALARNNSLPALFLKMDAVAEAEQAIRGHANLRLILEAMALRLADRAV